MSLNILKNLVNQAETAIIATKNINELQLVYTKFLGKKGYIQQHIKNLNNIPLNKRPEFGKTINHAKENIHILFIKQKNILRSNYIKKNLTQDILDITLPGRAVEIGNLHPITNTIEHIEKFFHTLGFFTVDGPELEDDYFNFDALNIPKIHPARNEQDTFWFDKNRLLRTHTSGMQIRTMSNNKKKFPIQIISFGRVYRKDYDKYHTPMFHQIEGFMVDTTINFSNLKNILNDFLHYFFGKNIILRFRPSYFPFTEPSAEIDIQDQKSTHWLEVLGCGIIHPNILHNVGIDSTKFSGFAFGIGIERLIMLLHHIKDIRKFFENDLTFLNQFK